MFCTKCGNQISDGAAFCPSCGNPLATQVPPTPITYAPPVATAEVQPSAVVKTLGSFVNTLKGIFSKNAIHTIGEQAKNTGLEWIIGIVLAVLSFSFAMPVNLLEILPEGASEEFPFFGFFGMSLLLSILVLGATATGIWLLANIVTKKNVHWNCVLNVVATAALPLSICFLLNMLLGLLWFPLVMVVSTVALFITVILLYAGFQKLENPVASPFYPFVTLLTVLVSVGLLLCFLLYKPIFADWSGSDEIGFSYIFVLIGNYFYID